MEVFFNTEEYKMNEITQAELTCAYFEGIIGVQEYASLLLFLMKGLIEENAKP